MSIRQALAEATAVFATTSQTPRLDAELLMAHALDVSRETLLLSHLDDPIPPAFATLVARRGTHEPIAYITGMRAFWTIELAVGPGALVPRPDSETLIEAAVAYFVSAPPCRILDLGTGPGTLLLAALDQWPEASGLGIDASEVALNMARSNALRLGMANRVDFRLSNWAAGVSGPFDLILSNPPYIGTDEALPVEVRAYEPAEALFAGSDGLDAYRLIAPQLRALLAPGGAAILEVGAGQAAAVTALLAAQGFAIAGRSDLGGHVRALIAS